jgi:hypothetical protein
MFGKLLKMHGLLGAQKVVVMVTPCIMVVQHKFPYILEVYTI